MNNDEILSRAENFLTKMEIEFVKPGEFGRRDERRIEVIYLKPDALDPNVIVMPPDVRVWVDIYSGEVTFVPQM